MKEFYVFVGLQILIQFSNWIFTGTKIFNWIMSPIIIFSASLDYLLKIQKIIGRSFTCIFIQ